MTDSLLLGHRARVKERFLTNHEALMDYELLELLLMYAIPRKDVKLLAKTLLKQFGSLGNVLGASTDDLMQIEGIKKSSVVLLKLVCQMNQAILKKDLIQKQILNSWETMENYCYALLGRETKENVYAIALDSTNAVISPIKICQGTVNQTSIYIREVIEALLKYHAVSFILVHNHPSGETRPSVEDIRFTKLLFETTNKINITMIDHFIVSPRGTHSFKALGLLKQIL